MARSLWLEFAGALDQVTARGHERRSIVLGDADDDRAAFLGLLGPTGERFNLMGHADCWMAVPALILIPSSRRLGRMPGPRARMANVEPILRLAIHGTGFRHPAGVSMSYATIIQILKKRIPSLLAIYAFGSRIQGMARPGSDLDLAVLVAGYADPLALFALAGELADVAGCPVDLLDLRAASTVMQYQIITRGERWWVRDAQAALFEAAIMSEKTELDTARSGLLADIQREGSVYGR